MNRSRRAVLQRDPLADTEALIRRVYSYVAYRMGDCADAEDVTSETFARAVRYRDSYDAAKGTPIGWLIGIARRCVDEAHRGPRPASDPPDRAAVGDLEADAVQRLTLMAAVGRLAVRDRELIALRYGADLSARQIAERLEMNTNAVEVALHRARASLRSLLDGEPVVRNQAAAAVGDVRAHDPGDDSDEILEAKPRPRARGSASRRTS